MYNKADKAMESILSAGAVGYAIGMCLGIILAIQVPKMLSLIFHSNSATTIALVVASFALAGFGLWLKALFFIFLSNEGGGAKEGAE